MSIKNNPDRVQERRIEANIRNEVFRKMTYEAQLCELDKQNGRDNGAVKQRAKIARKIADRDNKKKNNTKKDGGNVV